MNYFVQCFRNCKFHFSWNFILFWLFSLNYIGVAITMRKLMAVFLILLKSIPHLSAIETSGIPGFSQAEIIIAIGIAGIVAMNTLPGFITQQQRNSIIIQLQRDYAIYSSGFEQAISENGSPDNWDTDGSGGTTDLSDINGIVSKYFKVTKNCGTGPGCFPDIYYNNLKGVENRTNLNQDPLYTKFKLVDGTSVAINQFSPDCSLDWGDSLQLKNVCGMIVMDVNGDKSPNTYGMDFFGFAYTKYGLVALGSQMQNNYPFSGFCSLNSNANFKYENGLSCTAWAMYNKNMDYLDCKGLNWKGKTTCKA